MKAEPVLAALARRYERSQAGRTGRATRDLLLPLEALLEDAGASEGEAREIAERQLREAERAGLLRLEPLHKRDPSAIHQVRFNPQNEAKLYELIREPSPLASRIALAAQYASAANLPVPASWSGAWTKWCGRMREKALAGASIDPFHREPCPDNEQLLQVLPRLLAWDGESLVRFASCVLCGDSKALESLAPREASGELQGKLRGKLGRLLEDITAGQIRCLDDLGILPNPRFALLHGPLKLRLGADWVDFGKLSGAYRISQIDIVRCAEIATSARRCVTVENETSFHELAKLQSGELLVHTSFPGSGTIALLSRLPAGLEYWHFGDSDEPGFEILRVLREKSGRPFKPFLMEPGRVPFEQESLGRPDLACWPFYSSTAIPGSAQ